MNSRFVDTSGWASWISPTQAHHERADEIMRAVAVANRRLVTTTYVLAELTALLGRMRVTRERQIEVLKEIRGTPHVIVVPIEPDYFDTSWDLWRDRPDKEWTLTDCSSFVVMQARGLTDALTTDHHFEQAGFVRLLK